MLKHTLLALLITTILLGCNSGGKGADPLSPGTVQPSDPSAMAQSPGSSHMLWGMWEWIIDLENETFEAVPVRSANLHFNVAKILDNPPPKFGFSNFNLDKPNNTISLDVTLTHPFAGKPNLAGFNVKGILIAPGSIKNFSDNSISIPGPDDTHLLNPDGITRWWNPVEFPEFNSEVDPVWKYNDGAFGIPNGSGGVVYDATLNGFKLFSDDLTFTDPVENLDLAERAVFRAGNSNTRHYDVWFPLTAENTWILKYNYAVDASWAAIPGYQPGQDIDIPGDYPSNANENEAFMSTPIAVVNTLFWVDDTQKGGSSTFNMQIFDWQGYLDPGDVADQISTVMIECPTAYDGVIYGTAVDSGADPQPYAEYEFVIQGSHLISNGDNHIGLLTVESANGDYQPLVTQFAGDSPLAYYSFFEWPDISATAPPNLPPIAAATADDTNVSVDTPLCFDASDSTDPDGTIVSYEWDFDGDGTYGDSYDSGTDIQPCYIFTEEGEYEVDLMVTDNGDSVDTLDEKIIITVTPPNDPPVAMATADADDVPEGTTVTFDGSSSFDPDGSIVSWEWDFDGDGTWDIPDGGTADIPEHLYQLKGLYQVQLRVTDNLGKTDKLDQDLLINVFEVIVNEPPTACAEIQGTSWWEDDPVFFDASCSTDSDGEIAFYLWDFNNDGVYTDSYDVGTDEKPGKIFAPGDHTVWLKVIDNNGASDIIDVPFEFFVDTHVVITLPEDQAFKAANGYEYLVYYGDASVDPVAINYDENHGPWDFSTITYSGDVDHMYRVATSEPDLAKYIPSFFPSSTQYFVMNEATVLGSDLEMYFPEEADLGDQTLTIYGYAGYNVTKDIWEALAYTSELGGPIRIQFPMDVFFDEEWEIIYYQDAQPFITNIYNEYGYGEGYATVPLDGGYTDKALLTTTHYELRLGNVVAVQILLYKWTGDDGRQLARLYAYNTDEGTNFNVGTREITGEYTLLALNDVIE
ncbi:MAG TPA: PKD domain-containing protein [bacterium]|jgi:PKD repeat protein